MWLAKLLPVNVFYDKIFTNTDFWYWPLFPGFSGKGTSPDLKRGLTP